MILPHRLEWARGWLRAPKRLYIDGRWCDATGTAHHDHRNPADGRPLTSVRHASTGDVDRAVAAARRAFAGGAWRGMARRERARRCCSASARSCAPTAPSWRR